ncbi:MAG: phosphoribosylformylglycinamidine cyclo-ligase [Bacillota bacterium]|nr:MAG: phosphoribosylformylglycinamidine cyclo-ligase [Bacillota bacterium]
MAGGTRRDPPQDPRAGPGRPLTYRDSGVDVDAGNKVVDLIRGYAAATSRPESLGGIGGFGGLVALRAAGSPPGPASPPRPGLPAPALRWQDPVLVSGADGVGTKLKIAFMMDKHDTVGLDCVAYNVNDIACSGAEPLFFLDYIGAGRLVPGKVAAVVKGVAAGCLAAGCALAGGETAELPGLYAPDEYDLAGFAVGVVERARVIDGSRVAAGDVLVGLASTGLQSSGFSLVRRAVLDVAGRRLDEHVPEFGRTLGEELLTPTAIYPRLLLDLAARFDIKAIVNITGGGFYDNIPRAIPDGLAVLVQRGSWPEPRVFDFVSRAGNIEDREMFRTFNMGVGMALVTAASEADAVCRAVAGWGGFKLPGGMTVETQALLPIAKLAEPPRQAWPIGEVVSMDRLTAAARATGRRVAVAGRGGPDR